MKCSISSTDTASRPAEHGHAARGGRIVRVDLRTEEPAGSPAIEPFEAHRRASILATRLAMKAVAHWCGLETRGSQRRNYRPARRHALCADSDRAGVVGMRCDGEDGGDFAPAISSAKRVARGHEQACTLGAYASPRTKSTSIHSAPFVGKSRPTMQLEDLAEGLSGRARCWPELRGNRATSRSAAHIFLRGHPEGLQRRARPLPSSTLIRTTAGGPSHGYGGRRCGV